MKHLILPAILLLGMAGSARASLITANYSSGFENSGNILDGNSSGWSDTRTFTHPGSVITSVGVSLNLTGGFNGDLYAYLSFDGVLVPLLNRVGVGTGSDPVFTFGYADAGFSSLLLEDGAAAGDIHTYGGGGVPTGTYSPDGRNIDPLSAPATLYGTSRDTLDGTFGGLNPNGDWTLFIADVSVGGGQSQITSWGLQIEAVPEPEQAVLLGVVTFLACGLPLLRRMRHKVTPPAGRK